MSDGDPHIARYDNGRYWKVIRVDNRLIHAAIRSTGLVAAPQLHITLHSERTLSGDDIYAAIRVIRSMLHVDLDVKPFVGPLRTIL